MDNLYVSFYKNQIDKRWKCIILHQFDGVAAHCHSVGVFVLDAPLLAVVVHRGFGAVVVDVKGLHLPGAVVEANATVLGTASNIHGLEVEVAQVAGKLNNGYLQCVGFRLRVGLASYPQLLQAVENKPPGALEIAALRNFEHFDEGLDNDCVHVVGK